MLSRNFGRVILISNTHKNLYGKDIFFAPEAKAVNPILRDAIKVTDYYLNNSCRTRGLIWFGVIFEILF